jgi:spermidine synthase
VVHGFQLRAEADRRTPAAYFGPTSGVGVAIRHATSVISLTHGNLRIGVLGLGIGTIAAYGQPGDIVRYYEINPDVIRIASDQKYFSFLSDSLARVEVIPGDGRLSLERELEQPEQKGFDVLVIDAFSGDAVPVHLLTLEAFKIYARLLKKSSGILVIQITNTYLDLKPVVFSAAGSLGLKAVWVHSDGDGRITLGSDWVLLSAEGNFPDVDAAARETLGDTTHIRKIRPWTDDYSNLIQIVNH